MDLNKFDRLTLFLSGLISGVVRLPFNLLKQASFTVTNLVIEATNVIGLFVDLTFQLVQIGVDLALSVPLNPLIYAFSSENDDSDIEFWLPENEGSYCPKIINNKICLYEAVTMVIDMPRALLELIFYNLATVVKTPFVFLNMVLLRVGGFDLGSDFSLIKKLFSFDIVAEKNRYYLRNLAGYYAHFKEVFGRASSFSFGLKNSLVGLTKGVTYTFPNLVLSVYSLFLVSLSAINLLTNRLTKTVVRLAFGSILGFFTNCVVAPLYSAFNEKDVAIQEKLSTAAGHVVKKVIVPIYFLPDKVSSIFDWGIKSHFSGVSGAYGHMFVPNFIRPSKVFRNFFSKYVVEEVDDRNLTNLKREAGYSSSRLLGDYIPSFEAFYIRDKLASLREGVFLESIVSGATHGVAEDLNYKLVMEEVLQSTIFNHYIQTGPSIHYGPSLL